MLLRSRDLHGVFIGAHAVAEGALGLRQLFDGLQIARDDIRLRRLVAAGWRVIRLAAHDLRDMDAVVRRIAEELSRASTAG